MAETSEEREFIKGIINKCLEVKTRIDVGDYEGAKKLLDDIILKSVEKIRVVIF
jgi:hypothetical protein